MAILQTVQMFYRISTQCYFQTGKNKFEFSQKLKSKIKNQNVANESEDKVETLRI